jgi:hypothetical protein
MQLPSLQPWMAPSSRHQLVFHGVRHECLEEDYERVPRPFSVTARSCRYCINSNLPGTPPYQTPVGAAVEVTFGEVAPGQLIHEWRVVA